jgi:hypothetical protein
MASIQGKGVESIFNINAQLALTTLDRIESKITAVASTFESKGKEINSGAFVAALARVDKLTKSINKPTQFIGRMATNFKSLAVGIRSSNAAFDAFFTRLDKLGKAGFTKEFDKVLRTTRSIIRAQKALADAMANMSQQRSTLNQTINTINQAQNQAQRGLRRTRVGGGGGGGGGGDEPGFLFGIRRAAQYVASLWVLHRAFTAVRNVAREAYDRMSQLEQLKLGVAEVLSIAGTVTNYIPEALAPMEQVAVSIGEAGTALKKLVKDASQLGLPAEKLAESFTVTAGAARAAGISTKDSIPIVEGLAVLAERLQLPPNVVARDIRDIFTGLNVQRTILGNILQLNQGIVREAIRQGTLADLLEQRLKGVLETLTLNTTTARGLFVAIQSSLTALLIEIGGPALESIKDFLRTIHQELQAILNNPDRIAQLAMKLQNFVDVMIGLFKVLKKIVELIAAHPYLAGILAGVGLGAAAGAMGGGLPGAAIGAMAGGVMGLAGTAYVQGATPGQAADRRNLEQQFIEERKNLLFTIEQLKKAAYTGTQEEAEMAVRAFAKDQQHLVDSIEKIQVKARATGKGENIRAAQEVEDAFRDLADNLFTFLPNTLERTMATLAEIKVDTALQTRNLAKTAEVYKVIRQHEMVMVELRKQKLEQQLKENDLTKQQIDSLQKQRDSIRSITKAYIDSNIQRQESQKEAYGIQAGGARSVLGAVQDEGILPISNSIETQLQMLRIAQSYELGIINKEVDIVRQRANIAAIETTSAEDKFKSAQEVTDKTRERLGLVKQINAQEQQMAKKSIEAGTEELRYRRDIEALNKKAVEQSKEAVDKLYQAAQIEYSNISNPIQRQKLIDAKLVEPDRALLAQETAYKQAQLETLKSSNALEEVRLKLGLKINESRMTEKEVLQQIQAAETEINAAQANLIKTRSDETAARDAIVNKLEEAKLKAFELYLELLKIRKEFINIGQAITSSLGEALGKFVTDGGKFSEMIAKSFNEAVSSSLTEAIKETVKRKAGFDLFMKKNLLEYIPGLGKEGGKDTGANLIGQIENAFKTGGNVTDILQNYLSKASNPAASTPIQPTQPGPYANGYSFPAGIQQAGQAVGSYQAGFVGPEVSSAPAAGASAGGTGAGAAGTSVAQGGSGMAQGIGGGIAGIAALISLYQGMQSGSNKVKSIKYNPGVTQQDLVNAQYGNIGIPLLGPATGALVRGVGRVGGARVAAGVGGGIVGGVGGFIVGGAAGGAVAGGIAGASAGAGLGAAGGAAAGAGAGAAAGASAGAVAGPIGAAIGVILGVTLGLLLAPKVPKTRDIINQFMKKVFKNIDVPQLNVNARKFELRADLMSLKGQAKIAGNLLGASYKTFGRGSYQSEYVANAILNNAQALGLSMEDAQGQILEITKTFGKAKDLVGALLNVRFREKKGGWRLSRLGGGIIDEVGALILAFNDDLPRSIDQITLAYQAFTEAGVMNTHRLQRAIEDLKGVVSAGGEFISTLAKAGDLNAAGKSWGESLVGGLIQRIQERLIETPIIGQMITVIGTQISQAAEFFAAGQVDLGNKALNEARRKAIDFESNVMSKIAPFYANLQGFQSAFGVTATAGLYNQTPNQFAVRSYATPSFTRVPGPNGRAQPAIVHGGEPIRSAQQEDKLEKKMNELIDIMSDSSGKPLNYQGGPVKIIVKIGEKELAAEMVRMETSRSTLLPKPNIGMK